MRHSFRFPFRSATLSATAGLVLLATAGCSSIQGFVSGDRVDYRSQSTTKAQALEVPPDLTQLARDTRYQPQAGTVSAAAYQSGAVAPGTAPAQPVAPQAVGDIVVRRDGQQRWLVVPMTPEQLWPQLRTFWQERGFTIAAENREAGVMETDWAENRAKLPDDILRRTLGRLIDSLYSTGERDRFRTRIERTAAGTEVYITHKGMEEVLIGNQKEQAMWTGRPSDPSLEAEFLQRLMARLGTPAEQARTALAAAPATGTPAPARARAVGGTGGAALQVDDDFDRAWRRVGLALDRNGFTVEDRDRAAGLFYVRYVDPKLAGREEPGFFSRLFSFGSQDDRNTLTGPGRYRVALKGEGPATRVAVLNSQGAPESGEIAQRIVELLVDDLK